MFENRDFVAVFMNTETGEIFTALVKAVDYHEAREHVRKDLTTMKNLVGLVHEATA
jgi:hypothetical protein